MRLRSSSSFIALSRASGAVCAARDSAARHNALQFSSARLPTVAVAEVGGAGRSGGRSLPFGFLLNLKFRNENGRRNRGNRHAARFGAAIAVEYFGLVRCREDPSEARQGCADNVDASHEFIGPAIRIHPIHDQRNHLERLETRSSCGCVAACDMLEVKSVRLALPLDLVDQHLPQLRIRHLLCWIRR